MLHMFQKGRILDIAKLSTIKKHLNYFSRHATTNILITQNLKPFKTEIIKIVTHPTDKHSPRFTYSKAS